MFNFSLRFVSFKGHIVHLAYKWPYSNISILEKHLDCAVDLNKIQTTIPVKFQVIICEIVEIFSSCLYHTFVIWCIKSQYDYWNVQHATWIDWWLVFYGHFCPHGRLNGPPKVMKRSQRWNNLQICPRRDSNRGGSDLWSNTLPLDQGGVQHGTWNTSMHYH